MSNGEMETESSENENEESGSGREEEENGLALGFGAWQLAHLKGESRAPFAPAVTAYASQLFLSGRFKDVVPPDVRSEQIGAVLCHTLLQLIEDGSFGSAVSRPRYIVPRRPGKTGKPPADHRWRWRTSADDKAESTSPEGMLFSDGSDESDLDESGAPSRVYALSVCPGSPAPSRRRAGATSPTVEITPGRRISRGAMYSSLAQLELYDEACLHLYALLEQLPTTKERMDRCIAEIESLQKVVSEVLFDVPTSARLEDRSWWAMHAKQFIRSDHLQVSFFFLCC